MGKQSWHQKSVRRIKAIKDDCLSKHSERLAARCETLELSCVDQQYLVCQPRTEGSDWSVGLGAAGPRVRGVCQSGNVYREAFRVRPQCPGMISTIPNK